MSRTYKAVQVTKPGTKDMNRIGIIGAGAIVGSSAGTSAPWPGIADYAASKAAVALYTVLGT